MKKICLFFALSALVFVQCKEQPQTPPEQYKVKASENFQPILIEGSDTEAASSTLGVECISGEVKTPITISFDVDPSLVPEGAQMLPAVAFALSDNSAVIQAGKSSADITVSARYDVSLEPNVRYVVPLTLSCDSDAVEIETPVVLVEVSFSPGPYDIRIKTATLNAVGISSSDTEATTRTIEIECTNQKMYEQASVMISVDETAVPQDKVLLPAASYILPTTAVLSPDSKTAAVEISISFTTSLVKGNKYVLPIRISSNDPGVRISSSANLISVDVTVNKALGAVPIKGALVSSCAEFFFIKDKYLITRNATTGDVLRFEYDADTMTLGESTVIGTGYTLDNVRLFGPGPANTIHYVANNVWYAQKLPDDCSSIKPFDDASRKQISTGCLIFLAQLCGVHSAGLVFVNRSSGSLFLYPFAEDGLTLSGGKTDTDSDGQTFNFWNANYRYRFIYKDEVYGVGAIPGTLYRHRYDPQTKTFSRDRTEVGDNWASAEANILHITQLGDNLVVQKGNATLALFEFDPDNYRWDASGTATPLAQ